MSTAARRLPLNRPLHRAIGASLCLLLLYLGITGTIVQLVDIGTLLRSAPATDPDMMAIRESIDGPSNYAVIEAGDYAGAALPPQFDYSRAMDATLRSLASEPRSVRFVELRETPIGAVGRAKLGDRVLQLNLASGGRLILPPTQQGGPSASTHLLAKRWHRFWAFGDAMLWIDVVAGLALLTMVVSGLILYVQLIRARARIGRAALFWSAGGLWRSLHRGVSVVAAAFLIVVATTGTLLSIDSFSLQLYRWIHPDRLVRGVVPIGMVGDFSRPLASAALPPMLTNALRAYRSDQGERPIKAIRLRVFAGMPQAVVIAGGPTISQLVYNADTGRRMSMSEPGYPDTVFPTGWELHELLKRIHRGDAFGLPGRFLDLGAGFALVFLTLSGLWMYLDLWSRRRRAGRRAPFWR